MALTMMSNLLNLKTMNLNSRDNEGRTALEWAIRSAQPKMVSLLCSQARYRGRLLDLRDASGVTLLRLVIILYRETTSLNFREIARALLKSGHETPDSIEGTYDSLLELCKSYGLDEISQMIETFLEGGDLGPLLI